MPKNLLRKKHFFLSCLLVFLMGCSNYQYNTEICDSSRRVDVPAFDGNYVFYSQDENFVVTEIPFVLKRIGVGSYEIYDKDGNEGVGHTCEVGGRIFIESVVHYTDIKSQERRVYGYNLQELIAHSNDFLIVPFQFDSLTLSALRAPFEIIDKLEACMDDPENDPDPDTCKSYISRDYMVIDNSMLPPERLLEAAKPYPGAYRFVKK